MDFIRIAIAKAPTVRFDTELSGLPRLSMGYQNIDLLLNTNVVYILPGTFTVDHAFTEEGCQSLEGTGSIEGLVQNRQVELIYSGHGHVSFSFLPTTTWHETGPLYCCDL